MNPNPAPHDDDDEGVQSKGQAHYFFVANKGQGGRKGGRKLRALAARARPLPPASLELVISRRQQHQQGRGDKS